MSYVKTSFVLRATEIKKVRYMQYISSMSLTENVTEQKNKNGASGLGVMQLEKWAWR